MTLNVRHGESETRGRGEQGESPYLRVLASARIWF